MSEYKQRNWFDGIEEIISDPLRFKARLAIGEDAYTSLRVKNAVFELWDAAGAATTAAAIAKSSAIASTFFAPSGMLAFFGLGAAATPLGWVLAAGVVAGGGWIGITRYLKQATDNRVTTIPEFINTPLDVLALGLFDLMAPLAMKVASIDGNIDESERDVICSYFVRQWGYADEFVPEGLSYTESRLSEFSIKGLAQSLAEFKKENKDCNYKEMSRELVNFLREVAEADGRLDEREEMAVEKVQAIFDEVARFHLKEIVKKGVSTVADVSKSGAEAIGSVAKKIPGLKINEPVMKD